MRAFLLSAACALVMGCASAPHSAVGLSEPPAAGAVYESGATPGSRDAALAEAHGYVEQEFFLSGRANIYRYAEGGGIEAATRDVPYTTRLLVMRPRDPSTFSGRLIVAPFHPARGSNFWQSVRDYVLREGHIYVGVFIGTDERSRAATAQAGTPSDGLSLLLVSAPERYAGIVWPRDDGVRWDVFGQTVRLLRSEGAANPLREADVASMYAVGWSFNGSFLRTFINEGFHDRYRRENGAPAIDGYLIGISQHNFASGYVPLNAETPILPGDDARRLPRAIDAPVIELMTESEAVTKLGPAIAYNSNTPGRHRIYEVPGVTHGDGLRDDAAPSECPFAPSDVPFRRLAWAALENLDAWVTRGVAPPRQAHAMIVEAGGARRDDAGNAAGGVRSAQIAVPLARYGDTGDARCAPRAPAYLEIRRVPFTREELARRYPGGEAEYLRRFEQQLDALIAERWLLPEDRNAELAEARAVAVAAFR